MDTNVLFIALGSIVLPIGFWIVARWRQCQPKPGMIHRLLMVCFILLGIAGPAAPTQAAPAPFLLPGQGCTTIYAYDGQVALGGNNEDFINPITLVWYIPASPGKYGRVYFGFDDYIPQGGMNDQGVFFDAEALPYKAMPLTSQKPHYPDGDLAYLDQVMATSAKVQDVIDLYSRWYRPAGEYAQHLFGDRFGYSVIFDGDTVLPKQGAFQISTNFRLVENPNPPYPEIRYGIISEMLSKADHFSVDLFRQALDIGHAEVDAPTLYSQVYELNTGIIHLYQFHDFQHEVVINLAEELAKGPHAETIASLFPKNQDYEQWAFQQKLQWEVNYEQKINVQIKPSSLSWMSGEYVLQEEAGAGPVKVYLENDQLYLQKPSQLPIELYPSSVNTVFHHFFNGEDLTLTFQRSPLGQATGAEGSFSFQAYNLALPYHLTRTGGLSSNTTLVISVAAVVLLLILLGTILWLIRKRSKRVAIKH